MKKKATIITIIVVALLAISIFLLNSFNVFDIIGWKILPGAKANNGTLSVTSEDKTDLSNIPEGEIRYRINKNITFEDFFSKGDVMIENPPACKYDLKFSFYLSSTSEMIYSSDFVKPGQFISGDKLDKKLSKGTYECAYLAKAYENGQELTGETTGYLKITVEN